MRPFLIKNDQLVVFCQISNFWIGEEILLFTGIWPNLRIMTIVCIKLIVLFIFVTSCYPSGTKSRHQHWNCHQILSIRSKKLWNFGKIEGNGCTRNSTYRGTTVKVNSIWVFHIVSIAVEQFIINFELVKKCLFTRKSEYRTVCWLLNRLLLVN